jgi:hypothetical protein
VNCALISLISRPEQFSRSTNVAFRGNPDQLIQFHTHRLHIAILRTLNQEYHQKYDDAGTAIDYRLPGVGILVNRSGSRPDNHHQKAKAERCRRPDLVRNYIRIHSKTTNEQCATQNALFRADVAADREGRVELEATRGRSKVGLRKCKTAITSKIWMVFPGRRDRKSRFGVVRG